MADIISCFKESYIFSSSLVRCSMMAKYLGQNTPTQALSSNVHVYEYVERHRYVMIHVYTCIFAYIYIY